MTEAATSDGTSRSDRTSRSAGAARCDERSESEPVNLEDICPVWGRDAQEDASEWTAQSSQEA